MKLPDALLEYHADNYIARRIGAHGVSFEQYLTDPAHFDALALEPEPLLPAQRAAGEAWAGQITGMPEKPRPSGRGGCQVAWVGASWRSSNEHK